MKQLCLLILIVFIFGDTHLPKYDSIEMNSKSGVFYLKTSDFEAGSELYFQLNVENGDVNTSLLYEFSSIEPSTSHSFKNYNYLSYYSHGGSSTDVNGKKTYSDQYYYEVKNNNTQKYLYVKYKSFYGSSLEIESTRFSLGKYILFVIGMIVGSIALLALIIVVVVVIRLKTRKVVYSIIPYNSIPQNQCQQQQNIYYEPESPQQTVN